MDLSACGTCVSFEVGTVGPGERPQKLETKSTEAGKPPTHGRNEFLLTDQLPKGKEGGLDGRPAEKPKQAGPSPASERSTLTLGSRPAAFPVVGVQAPSQGNPRAETFLPQLQCWVSTGRRKP